MRFYALIIFVVIWSIIRIREVFTDNCPWEDSIMPEWLPNWIFYPLAAIELIIKAVSIPAIFGCLVYIIWF